MKITNLVGYPNDNEIKYHCNIGQGQQCCAWLMIGQDGFECQAILRPKAISERLAEGTMVAARDGCDEVASIVGRVIDFPVGYHTVTLKDGPNE